MAFRSSTEIQASAYVEAKSRAAALKSLAQSTAAASTAGNVSANLVTQMQDALVQNHIRLTAIAQVPGIGAYAKSQENDNNYDVVAEFTAMLAGIATCRDWVITNFPSNGGYILKDQLTTSGTNVRAFTPLQLAGFVTQLNALIALIS